MLYALLYTQACRSAPRIVSYHITIHIHTHHQATAAHAPRITTRPAYNRRRTAQQPAPASNRQNIIAGAREKANRFT